MLLFLGIVTYVLNNGPGSLIKWQDKKTKFCNQKEIDFPVVYEGEGSKMPEVTWLIPEARRSYLGQGEALEREWRPEEVLRTSVLLI